MRWFLLGGAALLAITVAGVVITMKSHPNESEVTAPTVTGPDHGEANPAKVENPEVGPRSDAAFLAEAEPLARKFLGATSVKQMLPLIRNPELAEPRMRKFYQGENFEAAGIFKFDTRVASTALEGFRSVGVLTGKFDQKSMVFLDAPGAMKVDWESWVGWSEMTWQEFITTKPVEPKTFRVILSPVEYYNFDFKNEVRWQSFRLEFPGRERSIYGYAERDSSLAISLLLSSEQSKVALMLALKFPPDASSDDVVEIVQLVNRGWVELEDKR